MASQPGSDAGLMPTDQRSCGFYIGWFFKVYQAGENGWWLARTPDDGPMTTQDAYFHRCLEVIAQTMMELRIEAMQNQK
jgi:hypothetical protein